MSLLQEALEKLMPGPDAMTGGQAHVYGTTLDGRAYWFNPEPFQIAEVPRLVVKRLQQEPRIAVEPEPCPRCGAGLQQKLSDGCSFWKCGSYNIERYPAVYPSPPAKQFMQSAICKDHEEQKAEAKERSRLLFDDGLISFIPFKCSEGQQ